MEISKIAARYINKLQWVVIALKPKGKSPQMPKWNTQINLENCKKWLKEWLKEGSNLGLLCGEISKVIVLDIDRLKPKDDPNSLIDGLEYWNELTKEHLIPQTACAKSGRGGLHFFFAYNKRTSKFRGSNEILQIGNKKVEWNLLTDKMSRGGELGASNLVVLPSTHPDTGRQYEWIRDPFRYPVLEMPDLVIRNTRGQ